MLHLEEVRGNSLAKQGMDLIFNIALPSLASTLRYTSLFLPFDSLPHFGSISLFVNRFWMAIFGNLVLLCLNNTLCLIVISRGISMDLVDDAFVHEKPTIPLSRGNSPLCLYVGHVMHYDSTCFSLSIFQRCKVVLLTW